MVLSNDDVSVVETALEVSLNFIHIFMSKQNYCWVISMDQETMRTIVWDFLVGINAANSIRCIDTVGLATWKASCKKPVPAIHRRVKTVDLLSLRTVDVYVALNSFTCHYLGFITHILLIRRHFVTRSEFSYFSSSWRSFYCCSVIAIVDTTI